MVKFLCQYHIPILRWPWMTSFEHICRSIWLLHIRSCSVVGSKNIYWFNLLIFGLKQVELYTTFYLLNNVYFAFLGIIFLNLLQVTQFWSNLNFLQTWELRKLNFNGFNFYQPAKFFFISELWSELFEKWALMFLISQPVFQPYLHNTFGFIYRLVE